MSSTVWIGILLLLRFYKTEISNTYQGIFTTALPEFKALRDFEWIGYPEMRMDMVQTVLASHKHLHGLGLMYVNLLFF